MELRARAARKQESVRNKAASAERAELQSTLEGETTRARLAKTALEDEKHAYEEKGQALTGEHAQLQQQMQAARRAAEEAQAQLEAQRVKVTAFMAKAEAEAGARAAGATAAEEEMQKLLGEQRSSSKAALAQVRE